jgi:LysR family glycine cleavage system transcriptional activator
MKSYLPNLRALQAFEAFGRLGSVNGAAAELGVTPGAVSQQLKILEGQLGMSLILKDGRRATLAPYARTYHEYVSQGFERLRHAQRHLAQQVSATELTISGLPTLLLKWLNPHLHRFQACTEAISIRLEATHKEPNPKLLDHTFRLTYGSVADLYPHSRQLFTDTCFPVCSPAFLEQHPEATDPKALMWLPLIEIDWGPAYPTVPHWTDWLEVQDIGGSRPDLSIGVAYSLSSMALEAAINSQGATLAQASFASLDLELGRLVQLSDKVISMPEPYFVCWGDGTLEQPGGRDFLNWLLAETQHLR